MTTKLKAIRGSVVQMSARPKYMKSEFPSELVASRFAWPMHLPEGNCKDVADPDIFSEPFEEEQLEEAQEYCEFCPIRSDCLSIGQERDEDGVYGGVLLFRGEPSVLPKYRKKKR